MRKEEWRTVNEDGFEAYQVSDLGNVRSKKQDKVFYRRMKTYHDRNGYEYGNFFVNGKQVKRKVHRLVMGAFDPIDNMESMDVCHKDYDPGNNEFGNLMWTTKHGSIVHRDNHGINQHHHAIVGRTVDGTETRRFKTLTEAARYVGGDPATILHQIQGKQSQTHGWIFSEEEV